MTLEMENENERAKTRTPMHDKEKQVVMGAIHTGARTKTYEIGEEEERRDEPVCAALRRRVSRQRWRQGVKRCDSGIQ
jgi:hypothetical protein